MGRCKNFILHCIDYRIQPTIDAWIQERGYQGDLDRMALGGACQNRQLVLRNIDIAVEQHGVTNIILTQHEDCAGYGGHGAFSSLDVEREELSEDMRYLKKSIQRRHPNAQDQTFLLQEKGAGWDMVER